jgi:hypothetical protein
MHSNCGQAGRFSTKPTFYYVLRTYAAVADVYAGLLLAVETHNFNLDQYILGKPQVRLTR